MTGPTWVHATSHAAAFVVPVGLRRQSTARWVRPLASGLALAIVVASAIRFAVWGSTIAPSVWGHDYRFYLSGVRQWLATGSPYDPRTLAGPYASFPDGVYLHPPIALPLMAPFLVLPWVLWWVVPLGIIGWCIRSWSPPPWSWPVIALGATYWGTCSILAAGNSTLWIAALLAAGLRAGWPAVFIVVKPTLLPLAMVGARRRSWWIAGAILAIVSMAFWPLWCQWLDAVRNAPVGPAYNSVEGLGLYWIIGVTWACSRGRLQRRGMTRR